MSMFQPEIETMSREQIREKQAEQLKWQVKRVYENVPMYRERMNDAGVSPDDIKSLDDLAKLPFTTKQDLRDYYPFDLFAVPKKEIVRLHASSGTTGKQIVVGYTKNDLETWADCFARQLAAAGATNKSIVQVSYGYGLFTGGMGANGGAERIGAITVPTSSGNTERQIRFMCDMGTTHLCCTPSYAMYLGETVKEMGVKSRLKLKAGIFGAEPWTKEMRSQIEETLGISAFDIYGLTEIMGPGVAYECEKQSGMHICEDMVIAEIIDPDTGEVLPEGSVGELVFTTIKKEGQPLIRYRTRDLCMLDYSECKCGRTHVKMQKPKGRTDDMLIVRGVNVFPSQIEEVLLRNSIEVSPNYQIFVDRVNNTDTLDINIEFSPKFNGNMDDEKKKLEQQLRAALGIGAKVHLLRPKSIARSEGKAIRVIDNRELHD